MMNKETLKDRINQIIFDHAGGVKFMTMLAELSTPDIMDNFSPDDILQYIREEMSHLGVLEYVYDPGGMNREKLFIYTQTKKQKTILYRGYIAPSYIRDLEHKNITLDQLRKEIKRTQQTLA